MPGQKIASAVQINANPKSGIEHSRKGSLYDQIQPKSSRKDSSRTKHSNAGIGTPKDQFPVNGKIPLRDGKDNLSKLFDKRRTTIAQDRTDYSIAVENSFRATNNSSNNKNLNGPTGENFSKIFERKGQSNPINLLENAPRPQQYLQDKPVQAFNYDPSNFDHKITEIGIHSLNAPRQAPQISYQQPQNLQRPPSRVSTPVDSARQVI
jgi:hypothetical protein